MFSHFFIDRPIFSAVISLVIVIAGAAAMFNLPIAQYPDITPVQIQVTATYPGADAQTVGDDLVPQYPEGGLRAGPLLRQRLVQGVPPQRVVPDREVLILILQELFQRRQYPFYCLGDATGNACIRCSQHESTLPEASGASPSRFTSHVPVVSVS